MAPGSVLNFFTGFAYDAIPGWDQLFKLSPEDRLNALRDPAVRDQLRYRGPQHQTKQVTDWANCRIGDVAAAELAALVGRRIGDIAAERGIDPFDALLDVVVVDELLTGIRIHFSDDDEAWILSFDPLPFWDQRLETWRDPRALIGGSDAGAHLDMLNTFSMHTTFLAQAVRDRQLLPIEEAIWRITDVPARFYGLKGRGRISAGWCADLVLFDPETVGPGNIDFRADLPAGGRRLYSEPTGVECTLVNGVVTSQRGKLTGDTPGVVFRSGIDTETVSV